MKLLTIVLVVSLVTNVAYAGCNNAKPVFSCITKKGKKIEVCDRGKTIEYSFGKINQKPEIVLNVHRSMVKTTQWDGTGRWMSYSVDIPNANTVYNVFWGADRMSEDHPIEAGVNVFVKGKLAATVECADRIENNMEGIDLQTAAE